MERSGTIYQRETFKAVHLAGRSAFTLIDVLVSIFVIAVLIGILLPSLASVNETARRVVCQSNVRQIGLGVIMYANDSKGELPLSRFVLGSSGPGRATASPERMVTIRVDAADSVDGLSRWDGLGLLYQTEYLSAAKVFYCPSHRGDNPYSLYARAWGGFTDDEIVCNYHFRGEGPSTVLTSSGNPQTTRLLWNIDPAESSLIADGMRVKSDYNHKVGVNFFRADLTVHWYNDPASRLQDSLPADKSDATAQVVRNAWNTLDASANGN